MDKEAIPRHFPDTSIRFYFSLASKGFRRQSPRILKPLSLSNLKVETLERTMLSITSCGAMVHETGVLIRWKIVKPDIFAGSTSGCRCVGAAYQVLSPFTFHYDQPSPLTEAAIIRIRTTQTSHYLCHLSNRKAQPSRLTATRPEFNPTCTEWLPLLRDR